MEKTAAKRAGEEQPTRFWEKISLLAEIGAICRDKSPGEELYREVLELIRAIVPFDAATVYLIDHHVNKLKEAASVGGTVDILSFLPLGKGTGLSGWVVRQRKPVLLSDRSTSTAFDPDKDFATIMSLPLLVSSDGIGVLNLGCFRSNAFRDKDVKLLTVVADQFAISIERQQYVHTIKKQFDALRRAQEELQAAHDRIIASEKLSAVIELAASINHQINNPLAVIVGNLQCLQLELKDLNQKALSRLRHIEGAAMRIRDVNQKLLQIHQIVSETYLTEDESRMLDLDKSTKPPEEG